MSKTRWRDRFRYAFDNVLAKGTMVLVGWLGLISVILVAATTLVVWSLGRGGGQKSLAVIVWNVLFQALTPNPVDSGSGPVHYLLGMLFITFCSLFIISILIGILTSGIEDRLRSLRKGRSKVIESGHTVILGWDTHIITIISELIIANREKPRSQSCVVILGERDKGDMDEEIREKVGRPRHTRVVCRSGNPLDPVNLDIVGVNASRSIIILAPDGEDPDTNVIKALLAIVNNPRRRKEPYHIVAELHDPDNMDAARLAGGGEAELILVGQLSAKIIAQTCRRSGLSAVYTELLNFEGDEIYFQEEPALAGKTFGEALMLYESSTVIGVRPKNGGPRLNPPMGTVIGPGDRIIAISEDFNTVVLSGLKDPPVDAGAIVTGAVNPLQPERTMVLGWNWRAPLVISELDSYVAPGSAVTVVADDPSVRSNIETLRGRVVNMALDFRACDTADRRVLNSLGLESYQHVIVLSASDDLPVQKADARTIITLLHLRDIAGRTGRPYSIVSEMIDERNRDLAKVALVDDFIVSGKLSSLLLSQVSENRELLAVFEDLFDTQGSEIYIKPAPIYVRTGAPVNFYTVTEAARKRGEVAVGYRVCAHAGDPAMNYGIVTNPDKSCKVVFSEKDRIVVLAERE